MQKVTFQKWQVKKLVTWFVLILIIGGSYLCYSTWQLYNDKAMENTYWNNELTDTPEEQERIEKLSENATKVKVGTYVESLKEINMKSSYFRIVGKVWFSWEGDPDLDMVNNFHVYNGTMNSKVVEKDITEGNMHYQLCKIDVSVFKNFWTKRFPLESHQLRFYIEPSQVIDYVVFVEDEGHSTVNPSFSIAGYNLIRYDHGVHTNEYNTTYGEPGVEKGAITSEFLTQIELNRDSLGTYTKCFIALFGTALWVFITMFLCTYHRVDPLSMIPAALFGAVSNIMVGANLLPDALEIGLLEYVNVWGILTILGGALVVININRIRTRYNDNKFAALFGRIITFELVFIVLLGHVLMPMAAYMWQ
ncbi:hypothetical protein M2454_002025 [Aequitasia blattaphilus]|uniref:Uncharacterized protein n=1 Tax=Aequitasia blattaphilus TaxID=2949332 RepID=A0ABT1ECY4_9FIRM|nr:hypothetical protein [Aequitasia blattaphilus]MCP1102711.1 hypothetical protein [Aequitasia blattaphilus]MCR8615351.1 hypothetical protein [Aequitasia blattaphilus]